MSRFVPERIAEWAYWISEREKVRKAKASGKPPPYTHDPVIAGNRFCNVRRMDDKVSIWLYDNWYYADVGYSNYRTALIAGLLARMINKPATLASLTKGKRYSKWDYDYFYQMMYHIKETGEPVFTNAYIINGASGGPKIDQVLNAIRDCHAACDAQASRFLVPSSMQATAEKLSTLRGVGSFISGQVVADLRHVLGDVNEGWWEDRMTWAPPGPGSSRGMKYLLGVASAADMAGRGNDMRPKEFLAALRDLVKLAQEHKVVGPIFKERKLEAHDIQNTLCETGKFIRVKYGEGRAKNSYDALGRWREEKEKRKIELNPTDMFGGNYGRGPGDPGGR
jgi:hypothetical protein